MPDATWRGALDPANLPLAFQLPALTARLARVRLPAGVYRYRSVEDAATARERWERTSQLPQKKT